MTSLHSCPIDRPFALSDRQENSTPVGAFPAHRARTHCLSSNTSQHVMTCPMPLAATPESGVSR